MGSTKSTSVSKDETKEDTSKQEKLISEEDLNHNELLLNSRLKNIDFERSLLKTIDIYWTEVLLPQIEQQNMNTNNNEKKNNEDICFASTKSEQIIFSSSSTEMKKSKSKRNLKYFTDDIYRNWSWPLYFYPIISKEFSDHWPNIYIRCKFYLATKTNDGIFDDSMLTSAANDLMDLLWTYVAYYYWLANKCEFTLGDGNIMLGFLSKLNHMFRALLIAYDFEEHAYGKIVNHYLKGCLTNIDSELIDRAQKIYYRVIVGKKKNVSVDAVEDEIMPYMIKAMKKEYESIQFRAQLLNEKLLINNIRIKKIY